MDIQSITEKINKALTAAGLLRGGPMQPADDDVVVAERPAVAPVKPGTSVKPPWAPSRPFPTYGRTAEQHAPSTSEQDPPAELPRGRFLALSHTGPLGSRAYKLYVPASYQGLPMPLLLMLHGCKQNPDDFAAGTRMNGLADRHGFLVAYPAQTASANGSNCWNWFERPQQARGGSEPAILTGIVAEVARSHAVRADQVFVAGLSAGAAMAVILGRTYPEVFAGVAAHSGLPLGAAHDVPSAFAAMSGRMPYGMRRDESVPSATSPTPRTMVIHGDADHTVALGNGSAIAQQAVASFEAGAGPLRRLTRTGDGRAARRATVDSWLDEGGVAVVEQWVVEGGAHTWFGGDKAGSYTDASGPDASSEIVRFFLQP